MLGRHLTFGELNMQQGQQQQYQQQDQGQSSFGQANSWNPKPSGFDMRGIGVGSNGGILGQNPNANKGGNLFNNAIENNGMNNGHSQFFNNQYAHTNPRGNFEPKPQGLTVGTSEGGLGFTDRGLARRIVPLPCKDGSGRNPASIPSLAPTLGRANPMAISFMDQHRDSQPMTLIPQQQQNLEPPSESPADDYQELHADVL